VPAASLEACSSPLLPTPLLPQRKAEMKREQKRDVQVLVAAHRQPWPAPPHSKTLSSPA
jgi:hypothetical protein